MSSKDDDCTASLKWLSSIQSEQLKNAVTTFPRDITFRRRVMIELLHRLGEKPGLLADGRTSRLSSLGVDTEEKLTHERIELVRQLEKLLEGKREEKADEAPQQ